MQQLDDKEFYARRREKELSASAAATDPIIARLHWEMAERYAWLSKKDEINAEADGQE